MEHMDYQSEAAALSGELTALREKLHRCPELGNQERETARTVETWLHACGIETVRLTETAVMGVLQGGLPGKTAALRADMDALPLTEQTGAAFASCREGVMHACGHDVHMASALGAARLLSRRRETLRGAVAFFFQPDEEGEGGAQRMIRAGCLEGVDAVFGAHVSPELPAGTVGIRFGKFYAAADLFDLTVHGKSSHGAQPELGIDALAAAAELVTFLKALPQLLPGERSVVSVGSFRAGTVRNVIAGEAQLSGIVRTLGQDSRAFLKERFYAAVRETERKTGVSVAVNWREGYPGVVNHDAETRLVKTCAETLLGPERVLPVTEPTMTTEDFGYFLLERPGCFYHIGVGGEEPLHSNRFLPPSDILPLAAALHAAVLTDYLMG